MSAAGDSLNDRAEVTRLLVKLIDDAPGLVASVRTWFDKANGNSYLAGDIVEVFTGRIIPLVFQYGRDSERAVRDAVDAAGGELSDSRLVIFETEVTTERGCRHGGLVSFCRPVVGS
jgi:hypothetical protein